MCARARVLVLQGGMNLSMCYVLQEFGVVRLDGSVDRYWGQDAFMCDTVES